MVDKVVEFPQGDVGSTPQWQRLLAIPKQGSPPFSNLENIATMLARSPDLHKQFWYDEFLGCVITSWGTPARPLEDHDASLLKHYAQTRGGMKKCSTTDCHEAIAIVARTDRRNECREWIEACPWDSTPRLVTMMADLFGADQNDYTAAVGKCWMISMVARVFNPGCKVDTVPVFESGQGDGKSTALEILGGKWYAVANGDITNKDFLMLMDGHMILELAEMQGFSKADVERIKGIISTKVDRYRRPYARITQDHPRQTVLACTTNRFDWNRDGTGARRFWPISCGELNLDYARNTREQLFGEARTLYLAGEPWWNVPVADHKRETDARREPDPWDEIVKDYLVGKNGPIHASDILLNGLHMLAGSIKRADENRLGDVLRSLGWDGTRKRMDGTQQRLWVRK